MTVPLWRAAADTLFDPQGNVVLPPQAAMAICNAKRRPDLPLTRQPTKARAEAVREALLPILEKQRVTATRITGNDRAGWSLFILPASHGYPAMS